MIDRSEQGAGPGAPGDGGATLAPGSPLAPSPPPPGRPPPSPAPVGPGQSDQGHVAPRAGSTGGDVSLGAQLAAGGAPIDRSTAWTWLLFAALGFVGGQVVAVVFVSVTAAAEGKTSSLTAIARLSEPPTWYIVSTLLGLWAGFFGAAWLATGVKGTKSFARDLGLRFRWIDLIGIPIGAAGQFLVVLLYIPVSQHVQNFNQRFNAPTQRLTGSSHGLGYVVIGVLTVVGAPFFEELFFRGVLLRSLARLFGTIGRWVGPALAIVITGLVFGLAHDEGLQLLGLAVFGVILSAVSYRTGRLGMNMVAHASFNLVAVVAVVTPLALGRGVLF